MRVTVERFSTGIKAIDDLTGLVYRFDMFGKPMQGRPPKYVTRAVRRFVNSQKVKPS